VKAKGPPSTLATFSRLTDTAVGSKGPPAGADPLGDDAGALEFGALEALG
jgi:hypothetical protein